MSLFTVSEVSGQSGSEALDQHVIHHLRGRAGKGLAGDTSAVDHKILSSHLNIHHVVTVFGNSVKKYLCGLISFNKCLEKRGSFKYFIKFSQDPVN